MKLAKAFLQQAESCIRMGSPFMGRVLKMLATEWPEGTALDRRFATFTGDLGPAGASLPLRLTGGLHALVLKGRSPDLQAVYPPHDVSDRELRQALLTALEQHEVFLLDWIQNAPQTNEVRRSSVLIAGAAHAAKRFDLSIHLSELGASAGLNLMWDQYALSINGEEIGPEDPALTLCPAWEGPPPPQITPIIAERRGVDLNPLVPHDPADQLRLMAYLWADQPERLSLTRAAISVANATVDRSDAIDWLEARLNAAPQGRLHLIQHTVAWQYFPSVAQKRGQKMIETAGERATEERPLAWLSMESDGDTTAKQGARVTLRLWPGDTLLELGRADFHGRWVQWNATT